MTAPVDPFSKAVFTLSATDGSIEAEEAYLEVKELPADIIARIGRVKVVFNHMNTIHEHHFPIIGQVRYLSDTFGDAGLVKDGLELNYILPFLPYYSEITAGSFAGHPDNTYTGDRPLSSVQWRNFWDLDQGGLEAGVSYLDGQGETDETRSQLTGLNVRYKQKVTPINTLILETESMYNTKTESNEIHHGNGAYSYVGYTFSPLYEIGAGTNLSILPESSPYADTFIACQYKRTEFQVYKAQIYRDQAGHNGFLFNVTFMIGPHPVHEF